MPYESCTVIIYFQIALVPAQTSITVFSSGCEVLTLVWRKVKGTERYWIISVLKFNKSLKAIHFHCFSQDVKCDVRIKRGPEWGCWRLFKAIRWFSKTFKALFISPTSTYYQEFSRSVRNSYHTLNVLKALWNVFGKFLRMDWLDNYQSKRLRIDLLLKKWSAEGKYVLTATDNAALYLREWTGPHALSWGGNPVTK